MNKEWANAFKSFQSQLKKSTFDIGIERLLELRDTLCQEILSWRDILDNEDYYAMPFPTYNGYQSKTVAYSVWHISRIEDIAVNMLIQEKKLIFCEKDFQRRMNSPIITTGNELEGKEISDFSQKINIDELYNYFDTVKTSTDNWLKSISYPDLSRKVSDGARNTLIMSGVVCDDERSSWLIDYWCQKNFRGLIDMPLSRHWIMHTEASVRIIKKIKK